MRTEAPESMHEREESHALALVADAYLAQHVEGLGEGNMQKDEDTVPAAASADGIRGCKVEEHFETAVGLFPEG